MRIAIFLCYLAMAAGLATVASLESFPWVLAGTTLRAMGGGTLWVFSTQLLLHLVPAEVRGRVFATEFALLTLSMATSAAFGGWALDRAAVGIGDLLHAMAAIVLVPGLLWGAWTLRQRPS